MKLQSRPETLDTPERFRFEAPALGLSSWASLISPLSLPVPRGLVDPHQLVPADILALAAAGWGKSGRRRPESPDGLQPVPQADGGSARMA